MQQTGDRGIQGILHLGELLLQRLDVAGLILKPVPQIAGSDLRFSGTIKSVGSLLHHLADRPLEPFGNATGSTQGSRFLSVRL